MTTNELRMELQAIANKISCTMYLYSDGKSYAACGSTLAMYYFDCGLRVLAVFHPMP